MLGAVFNFFISLVYQGAVWEELGLRGQMDLTSPLALTPLRWVTWGKWLPLSEESVSSPVNQ